MKIVPTVIGAAGVGVAVTLATGLINTTPGGLVGAVWYGWPLNWINKLITYPIAWKVQPIGLVVDLVFWFVVALIVLMVMNLTKGGRKKR